MKSIEYFFAGFSTTMLCLILLLNTASAEYFTVTGYYSPLPKQEFYLTGDYESELKLNGKGIAGADGTGVFYGMIAAPENYKFGTNICLAKLGCGSVHDRGGAIVNKGERKKATHDRIDFWMGYGMEGLQRSLLWGRQNVLGNITNKLSDRSKSGRSMNISGIVLKILRKKKNEDVFTENLYPGNTGINVLNLKESLNFIKLFKGEINNKYDNDLKLAVTDFQEKYGIISNKNDYGSGNFGPKTRDKLEEILPLEINKYFYYKWNTRVFEENLGYTDHGIDVYRLQQLLYDQNFTKVPPTGFFGNKTRNAVIEFQKKHGLIKNNKSVGAGNIGPKTREKLTEIWLLKREKLFNLPTELLEVPVIEKNLAEDKEKNIIVEEVVEIEKKISNKLFDDSVILFRGKRNDNVRKLQKELKKLGFFAGNTTGYYGDKTAEAVLAFQFKHKIVDSRGSIGAFVFGPSTRSKLNELI